MSQENVEQLRKAIVKDPLLQKRLEEPDMNKFVDILIGIGAERGLPITRADVSAFETNVAPSVELSEVQLQSVAGGAYTRPIKDGTSYSYGSDWRCGICGSTSGTWGTSL